MRASPWIKGAVRYLAAIAGALTLANGPHQAQAAEAHATLTISITVPAYSMLQVAPPRFVLSEQDIARGYVDVAAPVVITVRSNVREGYTLLFAARGDQVEHALLSGSGLSVEVGKASAQAARPAPGPGLWSDTVQLHVRLVLAKTATPGEHPWPVAISMVS